MIPAPAVEVAPVLEQAAAPAGVNDNQVLADESAPALPVDGNIPEHAPVNVWGSIVFTEAMQVKINTRIAKQPRRTC